MIKTNKINMDKNDKFQNHYLHRKAKRKITIEIKLLNLKNSI